MGQRMPEPSVLKVSPGTILPTTDGGDIEVLQPRLTADGVFLQYREGSEVRECNLAEAISRIQAATQPITPARPPKDLSLLASLSPDKSAELLQREAHVRDVVFGRAPGSGSSYDQDKTTEVQRRKAKQKELGLTTRASKVSRWVNCWKAEGLIGLVHGNARLPGDVFEDVSAPVVRAVRAYVEREGGASRKDVTTHYAIVLHDLERYGLAKRDGREVDSDGKALLPAEEVLQMQTFRRLWSAMTKGANPQASAKTAQSRNRRPADGPLRHRALDFGDVIQIDSVHCDFEIIAPDGTVVRPWLIVAVDVATRLCWCRLVPWHPTGVDVGLLLFEMYAPSSTKGLDDVYGPVAQVPRRVHINAWMHHLGDVLAPVIPGVITIDHGSEGENGHVLSGLAQWGTQVEWARTMNPTDKAHVESLNRNFAVLSQILPGHIGNAVENRPDIGATRQPATYRAAAAIMRVFPLYYAAQPHLGLPHPTIQNRFLTPNEACMMALARGVPLRIPANPSIGMRFLPHIAAIPQDDGVPIKKTTYWCPGYPDLINAATRAGRRRDKLIFHVDPYDMTRIFWNEPDSFTWRILWAPGADGGEVGPLADIREQLARNLAGHKRPTHKQSAVARKELVAVARQIVEADAALPQVDFAYAPPASDSVVRGEAYETSNGGWDLSDLGALEPIDWDDLSTDDEDGDEPW